MLIGGQAEKARDMEGTLEIKAGREKRVYICLIARRESRLIFVLRDWKHEWERKVATNWSWIYSWRTMKKTNMDTCIQDTKHCR